MSKVSLAPDISFESPLSGGSLQGVESLLEFLFDERVVESDRIPLLRGKR